MIWMILALAGAAIIVVGVVVAIRVADRLKYRE
jgi:hypothetical protein